MEVPFFVPTSHGDLAVGATLDPGALGTTEPVLFLPGGDHPRSRNRVRLEIARELALRGRAVFRLDYPGAGLSPIDKVPRGDTVDVLLEVVTWVRQATGSDTLAVGGTCGGARHAIALSARDHSVSSVVAIDCPIARRRKTGRRLRAGIAAIDPLGGRVASVLAAGGRGGEANEWFPGLIEDLAEATKTARIAFVYGGNDIFYGHLKRLITEEGLFPPGTTEQWTLEVRPDAQLYGFSDPEDMKWLRGSVVSYLTGEAADRV